MKRSMPAPVSSPAIYPLRLACRCARISANSCGWCDHHAAAQEDATRTGGQYQRVTQLRQGMGDGLPGRIVG